MYSLPTIRSFPTIRTVFQQYVQSSNNMYGLPTICTVFQQYVRSSNNMYGLPTICTVFQQYVRSSNNTYGLPTIRSFPTIRTVFQQYVQSSNNTYSLPTICTVFQQYVQSSNNTYSLPTQDNDAYTTAPYQNLLLSGKYLLQNVFNFTPCYKAKPLCFGHSIRTKYGNFLINTGTQSHVPTRILKYPKCRTN